MRRAHLAGAGSQNRPLTTRGGSKWKRTAPSLAWTGESTTNTDGVRPCCDYATQRKTGRSGRQQDVVGGDGELAVQKQEETKQEKSQQAQGHEETGQGQLGNRLEGTPEGEGVCVQGTPYLFAGEGTGWTGTKRLVFSVGGWTCPCWRRNACVHPCIYVPTQTILSVAVGGVGVGWVSLSLFPSECGCGCGCGCEVLHGSPAGGG